MDVYTLMKFLLCANAEQQNVLKVFSVSHLGKHKWRLGDVLREGSGSRSILNTVLSRMLSLLRAAGSESTDWKCQFSYSVSNSENIPTLIKMEMSDWAFIFSLHVFVSCGCKNPLCWPLCALCFPDNSIHCYHDLLQALLTSSLYVGDN